MAKIEFWIKKLRNINKNIKKVQKQLKNANPIDIKNLEKQIKKLNKDKINAKKKISILKPKKEQKKSEELEIKIKELEIKIKEAKQKKIKEAKEKKIKIKESKEKKNIKKLEEPKIDYSNINFIDEYLSDDEIIELIEPEIKKFIYQPSILNKYLKEEEQEEEEEEDEEDFKYLNVNFIEDPHALTRKYLIKRVVRQRNKADFVKKLVIYDPTIKNIIEYLNNIYQTEKEEFNYTNQTEANYVVISLWVHDDDNEGHYRHYTLKRKYFDSIRDFKSALVKISDKSASYGSDAVIFSRTDFIITNYSLVYINPFAGGTSKRMLFETLNIKSKNNLCSYISLLECGYDYGLENAKDLQNVDTLIKVIKNNNLKISLIANSFKLKPNVLFKDILINKKDIIFQKQSVQIGDIDINKIDFIYLHQSIDCENTLIYDSIEKHIDILKDNKIIINKNIQMTDTYKILKDGKLILTCSQFAKNMHHEKKDYIKKFLIFDYETIVNYESFSNMLAYSLSIAVFTEEELINFNKFDLEYNDKNNEMKIKRDILRQKHCTTFLGYDCNEQFINWLHENEEGIQYLMIGFNNSNFDNILLLEHLLKRQDRTDATVSEVFYSGNGVLNMKINKRHTFLDIRKHLVGSLKECCKAFKINCFSKKDFDHTITQNLYNEDPKLLINYINTSETLKEYNEYDVLATGLLFIKYKKVLGSIKITKSIDLEKNVTIGSCMYKVFSDDAKKNNYEFPKLNLQHYTDLQKYKIAGRVECFHGCTHLKNIKIRSCDVCSLYPYIMAIHNKSYFPIGEIIEVDTYRGNDVVGFYYCDIDQSNLKSKNLPLIYAEKTETQNNWATSEILNRYLISNVMIRLLIKHGCRVTIHEGFIFTETVRGYDLFSCILDFMKVKNEQDYLKKCHDPAYNAILREVSKLFMNSLSGKVIEGLHTEKTEIVDKACKFLEIQAKAKDVSCVDIIGNDVIVTYTMEEEELLSKQRPIYLGVLIYDYSKAYMYEESYEKIGLSSLIYTDTDASKFSEFAFKKWVYNIKKNNTIVPHWIEIEDIDPRYKTHLIYEPHSKIFGSFEDEFEHIHSDTSEYKFFALQKKTWGYFYKKDKKWLCADTEKKITYRFKGLTGKNLILDTKETIIGKDKKGDFKLLNKTEEENIKIYNYIQENKNKSISDNVIQFFDKLYEDKYAYVLCDYFKKIIKNTNRNVNIEEKDRLNTNSNTLKVCYLMKKISIK